MDVAAQKTGYSFSGVNKPKSENGLYSLRYAEFVVPLVKAVQEQQVQISDQQKLIESMKKELEEMKKEIELIKKK